MNEKLKELEGMATKMRMSLRTEFKLVIKKCWCGKDTCHPKECFPELYRVAYPKGGMNMKRAIITKRRLGFRLKELRNE